MREVGIVGLHLRKGRRTMIPDQRAAAVPDLLAYFSAEPDVILPSAQTPS
jgi:hypothetical protein